MVVAADEAGTDFPKIALEIGEQFFRNPEALRLLGLRVLGIEEKVHAGSVELDMSRYGKRSEAPAPYWPEADKG